MVAVRIGRGRLSVHQARSGWHVAGSIIEVDASAVYPADQREEVPYSEREKVTVTLGDDTEREAWAYTRRAGKGRLYAGGATERCGPGGGVGGG